MRSGAISGLSSLVAGGLDDVVRSVQRSLALIRCGGSGVGAGIVWRSRGIVVTNYHVVAQGRPCVSINGGPEHDARPIALDPEIDLAVLHVAGLDEQPAPVGDSQALRVGQLVLAVGHPWGQPGVVTAGIISSLGKLLVRRTGVEVPIIRSDVVLAPGNSGGPLVDANGAVIGINTMIIGGDQGIAIPSQVASAFITAALDREAALGVGVRPAPLPQPALAHVGRQQVRGLLVIELQPGGPAAGAGIQPGDILVDLSGAALDSPRALMEALAARRPGERVALSLLRGDQWRRAEVDLTRLERAP